MTQVTFEESNDPALNPKLKESTQKLLLYVSIISMVMVFAGLTSAYIVSIGGGTWLNIVLPFQFSFSTAVLLISSITIHFSLQAAKKNNTAQISLWLWATFLMGVVFMALQYAAWGELYDNKIYFTGKSSNAAGSFLYVITGLHVAHLVGGLLYLISCIWRAHRQKFNASYFVPLKLCAIYWHFLDAVWLYLFIFLLYFR